MARANVSATVRDGGIGYRGPDARAVYAVIGVASGAEDAADQQPEVVTSPDDVETLFGIGPLRDMLVHSLSRATGTVLVLPLQRNSGGGPQTTTAIVNGTLSATVTGWSYIGQDHEVILEVTTAGAAGTAAYRLIVDGEPQAPFTPASGDYGSAYDVPAASQGPLNEGTGAGISLELVAAGDKVLGAQVSWRMADPKATVAAHEAALTKLAASEINWEGVAVSGVITAATAETLQVDVNDLPDDGRYVWFACQLAGSEVRSQGSATSTAAWVSDLVAATSPTRYMDPRLTISTGFRNIRDPITRRRRVTPFLYPALGHLAIHQAHEPPDAVEIDGARNPVAGIERDSKWPADLTDAQANSLDDAYYMMPTEYPGEAGVFVLHWRMFGRAPSAGVTGTDFTGIERRRVMDNQCRSIRQTLFSRLNGNLETDPATGELSAAERAQLTAQAQGPIDAAVAADEITDGRVTVRGKAPGVLQTGTLQADLEIIPLAKNEDTEVTLAYAVILGAEGATT